MSNLISHHLGTLIHNELCSRPQPCGYEAWPRTEHHAWYQDRARSIYSQLEPHIGSENVMVAAKIIIGELW